MIKNKKIIKKRKEKKKMEKNKEKNRKYFLIFLQKNKKNSCRNI